MNTSKNESCTTHAEQEATINKLRRENDALKVENAMLKQTIASQEERLVRYSWITNPDRMGQ